ncbi:transcriptional regulator, LacI family [Tangfeifania diversioriginum]|uniref:Transcriptional regulator, LacI family n=1 Tax=Tangfeifania diversioriginum TaxID=1168035 RepID=A0A1M6EMZ5_9BACT|nr:transcriptional regulator, LacI family [Tangfeifania diversioriginum]
MSIGTVDRVLHNRGEVAESTKKKILKIINELNYQPNILASTLASKKSAVFATLFPQPPSSDGYWNKPVIGVKKRISELQQYSVELVQFTFQQNNPQSFVKTAEKILELKPDGVILAPFFKKESLRFIGELKKQNIPFVFIDSEIKNADQLGYIGQNSYQSGLVSGKLLDLMLPSGNILIIHFAKEMDNQNHLVQREKGFYDWYSKNSYDNHQLFTIEVPDTLDEKWMEPVVKMIDNKNIKGIFVTNSKVFNVGHLIEKYKSAHRLRVIGHDLLKENITCLKKDIVQFLICQRPEEQGYSAINKLFRHVVQKRVVPKENYTSIDIVTKENVDYYKEFK